MPLLTPAGLVAGILLAERIEALNSIVPFLFAFITFSNSLKCRAGELKNVVLHPLPAAAALAVLHGLMPCCALVLGRLLFPDNPYFVTGMVIQFLIPTAVMTIIWVSIYGGNLPLTLGIVLADTFISPFLVPPVLRLLVGTRVEIDSLGIMLDLIYMVLIPAAAAMLLNEALARRQRKFNPKAAMALTAASKLMLMFVIAINSSKLAIFVDNFSWQVLMVCLVILAMILFNYLLALGIARLLRLERDSTIAFAYNCSMRNISLGAVIAAQYFPGDVLLPVMVSVLFQQILAAAAGSLMDRHLK